MTTESMTASLLPLLREGKPDAAGWLPRRIAMGAVLAVLLLIPVAVPDITTYGLWIQRAQIYVLVGISLNILMGHLGQISLGHQAFFGVGAFAAALAVVNGGWPFWIALFASAASGAIAAVLLGVIALRLKGLFLALITLAYGVIAENVLFANPSLTGGDAGVNAQPPPGFTTSRAYIYLLFVVMALFYFIDWRLLKSKAGRAILAIRENEYAAASFGVNVVGYKLLAFVVSGALAGVAGAFFAHQPPGGPVISRTFDFQMALTFVLMVAVGGLGSRAGIFIGSATFAILPLWLNSLTHWIPVIGGLLLLLTLTLNPGGVAQQIRPVTNWLIGKPFSLKGEGHGVAAGGAGVRP
ncbi:MAG TPA: branched-chain amino acid ABC transporter permease [Actinomycetota bacterium]